MLSAAHDVAEVHDDERSASMFEKVMFNDEDLINTGTDRLKVWPIEVDQEAFINVMHSQTPIRGLHPGRGRHTPRLFPVFPELN